MGDIQDLMTNIRKMCIAKGWREPVVDSPKDGPWFAAYIALAHSELSEALEAYRDSIWSDTRPIIHDWETVGKPIGVGPEIADVFIRVLDMADIWGIDLEYEVKRVLHYGHTRPYKHGGREL